MRALQWLYGFVDTKIEACWDTSFGAPRKKVESNEQHRSGYQDRFHGAVSFFYGNAAQPRQFDRYRKQRKTDRIFQSV